MASKVKAIVHTLKNRDLSEYPRNSVMSKNMGKRVEPTLK